MGLNFIFSATGSLLYLLGSIFFIPATNQLLLGIYLFIIGSTCIYLSQGWKCYRTFVTNQADPSDRTCSFKNLIPDTSGFFIDLFAGVGGFFYFIGTYYFKVALVKTELYNLAITLFTLGGVSFFLSGAFMQYRYFCKKN